MVQRIITKANVKKFSTQASKGGSIVITLEMPLTDKNAALASNQSKDCMLDLRFDNDSIEKADGQLYLFTGQQDGTENGSETDEDEYEYEDEYLEESAGTAEEEEEDAV